MIYSSYYSVIAPISLCLFAALTSLAAVRLYASYISAPKEDKQAAGEEKKIDEKIIVQTALFCMGVVEIVNSISFWVERG